MTPGLFGTGAPLRADMNLAVQLAMGVVLLGGFVLARLRRFRAHQACQTGVMLLNLAMIGLIMAPSFGREVGIAAAALGDAHTRVAYLHAALGAAAELLGLYVVLVAGTSLVPPQLRFTDYKPWMRGALALWWVVILFGAGTYYTWYLRPGAPAPGGAARPVAGLTILVTNFAFTPQTLTVRAGSTVSWRDSAGRHRVTAEDSSWTPRLLLADSMFEHRFDHPGRYAYCCTFHGDRGGVDVSGVVLVTP